MTTIKNYTDIEQSKKLAEILPLESADMKWFFWKSEIDAPKLPTFGYSKTAAENYKNTEAVYLPCWSLATLLGILPRYIEIEGNLTFLSIYPTKNLGWVVEYSNNQEDFVEFAFERQQMIDACYKMILKLHELNLI